MNRPEKETRKFRALASSSGKWVRKPDMSPSVAETVVFSFVAPASKQSFSHLIRVSWLEQTWRMKGMVWRFVYPGPKFMLASNDSPSGVWGLALNHPERVTLLLPGRGTKSSENTAKGCLAYATHFLWGHVALVASSISFTWVGDDGDLGRLLRELACQEMSSWAIGTLIPGHLPWMPLIKMTFYFF